VRARRCFAQTVGVLILVSVARPAGLLGPPLVSAAVLGAAVALVAWRSGASFADLGLSRANLRRGVGYGLGALAVVLVAVVLVAVIPATNQWLHDTRAEISGGRLGYELVVSELLLIAVPEELAFRGVLLGSAMRLWSVWRAVAISSVLFGLWHIGPTLQTMSDNSAVQTVGTGVAGRLLVVLGAVLATSVAGVVFSWLRLRSRSLVACVIAHFATNGVALAVAWFVVH
jgi:membrane protease YdiL (CAAX protease family)